MVFEMRIQITDRQSEMPEIGKSQDELPYYTHIHTFC